MAKYKIEFARSARKELLALDPTMANRVVAQIEALADNPRPLGCKKLKGSGQLWRIRCGDWRVVYAIDDAATSVDISALRNRSDVYR